MSIVVMNRAPVSLDIKCGMVIDQPAKVHTVECHLDIASESNRSQNEDDLAVQWMV